MGEPLSDASAGGVSPTRVHQSENSGGTVLGHASVGSVFSASGVGSQGGHALPLGQVAVLQGGSLGDTVLSSGSGVEVQGGSFEGTGLTEDVLDGSQGGQPLVVPVLDLTCPKERDALLIAYDCKVVLS